MKWIRGAGLPSATINFKKPLTHINLGPKESGKSCLLEACAIRYLENDGKVIDLFGSRDNEGLGWCRFKPVSSNEILFVHGDSCDLSGKWDAVKVRELHLKDLHDYRVVTSVSAFYGNLNEEFEGLNRLIYQVLYRRTHWRRIWNLTVREGSNFVYSRIMVVKNQTLAKSDFIYLLREARHMGYAVTVDTLKWTSIDLDIRHVSDYTWIKRVGIYGLPHDLRFLYRYINPYSLMDPRIDAFLVLSSRGPIGVGRFDEPYWHKKEHENLIKDLGINIEYREIPDYGNPARNTVNDFEHANLIAIYIRKGSMNKTAKQMRRSPATIQDHVHEHDDNVRKIGYCPKCQRIDAEHKTTIASLVKGKPRINIVDSWEQFEKTFSED